MPLPLIALLGIAVAQLSAATAAGIGISKYQEKQQMKADWMKHVPGREIKYPWHRDPSYQGAQDLMHLTTNAARGKLYTSGGNLVRWMRQ